MRPGAKLSPSEAGPRPCGRSSITPKQTRPLCQGGRGLDDSKGGPRTNAARALEAPKIAGKGAHALAEGASWIAKCKRALRERGGWLCSPRVEEGASLMP